MTPRQKQVLEAVGGVLLVAGLATINVAIGIIAAGVMLVLAANFVGETKEEDDSNSD